MVAGIDVESHASPPPLPSPIEGEGSCPYRLWKWTSISSQRQHRCLRALRVPAVPPCLPTASTGVRVSHAGPGVLPPQGRAVCVDGGSAASGFGAWGWSSPDGPPGTVAPTVGGVSTAGGRLPPSGILVSP